MVEWTMLDFFPATRCYQASGHYNRILRLLLCRFDTFDISSTSGALLSCVIATIRPTSESASPKIEILVSGRHKMAVPCLTSCHSSKAHKGVILKERPPTLDFRASVACHDFTCVQVQWNSRDVAHVAQASKWSFWGKYSWLLLMVFASKHNSC